jgi:hypothetical protein
MEGSIFRPEERSLGYGNLQAAPGDHTHDGGTSRGPVEFTPVWSSTGTQPVLGNGTLYGRYALLGKLVHLYIELTMGSTTTYGSGNYRLSLPITSEANRLWNLPGISWDTSAGAAYEDITGIVTGASTIVELYTLAAGVGSSLSVITNGTPITFATGDKLVINGVYGY